MKEDLFTERELTHCSGKARYAECFAARFAAKEAFLKAIGTGWRDGITFRQVEVITDELGKPELKLNGKANDAARARDVRSIHVSMSHEAAFAVAVVILEN